MIALGVKRLVRYADRQEAARWVHNDAREPNGGLWGLPTVQTPSKAKQKNSAVLQASGVPSSIVLPQL